MWCTYNNQILNFQYTVNDIHPLEFTVGRIINFQDMKPGKLYDQTPNMDRFKVFATTVDRKSKITKWYIFKE